MALKDQANLGFSIKGLTEKEQALLEGKGKIMHHLKFYSPNVVDEAKVIKLLKLESKKNASC